VRSSSALGAALLLVGLLSFGCERRAGEGATTAASPAQGGPVLESVDQRVSYGIGYNVGSNVSRQPGLDLDAAALRAGLDDGLAGSPARLSEQDLQAAFMEAQERAMQAAAKQGEANQTVAREYLEQNRNRPGVRVTDSGLQYEVLHSSGSERRPTRTDTVEVHYHGTLIDGTVFDSSVQRGEPISFPVTGVIPGWIEALQMMSVGDKWRLTIPPELAYGPRATGRIPANSALIFEVELLGIK
jgi:FKBP-type peptidyl-prolyl cis-trans isomerase FklB